MAQREDPSGGFLFTGPRRRFALAFGALAVSMAMCSGYFLSAACRAAWQRHFPELVARWPNDGRFTVLGLFGTELQHDELTYAALLRGAAKPGVQYDPYILENRSLRPAVSQLVMYKGMALFFHLTRDASWAWVLLRLACCAAWFYLVFAIVESTTRSAPIAFFCAVFAVCMSYLTTLLFLSNLKFDPNPWRLIGHNLWTLLSYGRTESVARLPRPGINYAILFLVSLLTIRSSERPGWRWPLLAGLAGGISAYCRLDSWGTAMAAGGVFAAVLAARGRPWRPVAAALALSAFLSIPFLWVNRSLDPELALRMGLVFDRFFNPRSLPYLLLFAVGVWRLREPAGLYVASLLGGTFLLLNLQLLTGIYLGDYCWSYQANLFAFFLLASFVPESWKRRAGAWLAASCAVLLIAFGQTLSYAAIHYPMQGLPRHYDEALRFLDRHAPVDSVVLSLNPEVNLLIPVFTGQRVVLPAALPTTSDLPTPRIAERLVYALDFFRTDKARFLKDCFSKEYFSIGRNDYRRGEAEREYVRMIYFYYFLPLRSVRSFIEKAMRNRPPPPSVDYVWFGDFERTYASTDFERRNRGRLKPVYRNEAVTLYELRK